MMPLTMLNPGESASIVRVGGNEETKRFLENLGFVAGSEVKVISSNEGNIIAQIKESRVAVSKGIANKIMSRRNGRMTLRDVKVDQTVSVVKLHGEGATKRRIMDMGITKGTSIYVRKVAPLGDPVEVTVRGYELSLRKADAEMIEVK